MTIKSGRLEVSRTTDIFDLKSDDALPQEGIESGFDFVFAFLVASI